MLKNKWTWTILGATAFLIRMVAAEFPAITEALYSRSIFPVIRKVMDASISRLPFPTVYLFLSAVLFLLGVFIYRLNSKPGWKKKSKYSIRSLINFSGMMVFLFLVFWGFNYQRVPIVQQLTLLPKPLDQEKLHQEILLTEKILSSLRPLITKDTLAYEEIVPYRALEDRVREELKVNMHHLGIKNMGHPRTKEFYPSGFLRKMGILGIYFPFTGESYIDPTLHPLEKPFTIAHEMAHCYGITNEGEANFTAWVVCSNSNDPLLQYAAQLKLFKYQLNDLYRISRNSYDQVFEKIEVGIRRDMASITKNAQQFKPVSQRVSRMSNDLFLKSQGVEAGIKSYAQLPMLAYSWRNRPQKKQFLEGIGKIGN